jgi:glucokinase
MKKRTLSIDIGGTNFSVALFEGDSLLTAVTTPTQRDSGPLWMLDRMEEIVASTLGSTGSLDGCGVGFGGPVEFATQRVIYSTHVAGWNDFDLSGEIARRFRVPVVIDRDSMAAALGEGLYGAGIGSRPLFYITLSTGVGGGFLTNAGLLRGADSYACELGHHTVLPGGPECLCGSSGCMERMCCGLWLERDYGRPAKELLQDPEFTRKYVVHLAQGVKNCIMFFNPARVVIGGGISKAGDLLFVPLRKELRKQMPAWSKARIDVVPAGLGGHSVLWGALALANEHLYAYTTANQLHE